jgi:hypothetical protein
LSIGFTAITPSGIRTRSEVAGLPSQPWPTRSAALSVESGAAAPVFSVTWAEAL